jgi:large subunit ribosomal protein L17
MTTTHRAKELRRVAENLVTHAKKNNLKHRQLAQGVVQEQSALIKLFSILGPRYKSVPSL